MSESDKFVPGRELCTVYHDLSSAVKPSQVHLNAPWMHLQRKTDCLVHKSNIDVGKIKLNINKTQLFLKWRKHWAAATYERAQPSCDDRLQQMGTNAH